MGRRVGRVKSKEKGKVAWLARENRKGKHGRPLEGSARK
jgi:hypothetical protein